MRPPAHGGSTTHAGAWLPARPHGATGVVEWDEKFGLVKVNPLATWTEAQVWKYIVENGVPYNELHDRAYPSIGCTYCTNPVRPGDDPRSGRWQGQDKVECGLHVPVGAAGLVQGVAGD